MKQSKFSDSRKLPLNRGHITIESGFKIAR
jgi:hypothetical protein